MQLPSLVINVQDEKDCPHNRRYCKNGCENEIRTYEDKRVTYITDLCRKKQFKKLLLKESGLTGKAVFETFENANYDEYNREMYMFIQEEWNKKRWIYIYSKVNGNGKSYTANAIGNMFIDLGIKISVNREIDMAARLKESFSDKSGDSEYKLMCHFRDVPVLVVQDFGKQGCSPSSEWWPQKIFDIIDYRCVHEKLTVFTSNYNYVNEHLVKQRFGINHGLAIQSRLEGSCKVLEMKGPDRRKAIK